MTIGKQIRDNIRERGKVKQQIKKDIEETAKKVIESRQVQRDESNRSAQQSL